MKNEILAQIPTEVYAFIGFVIVSNIALVASGLTTVVKHLIDHGTLKKDVARLELELQALKKSLDTVWDRMRGISKP